MIAAQQWMDVVANNLANASTTGFKRDTVAFDEAMLRELAMGVGQIGSGPSAPPPVTVFEPGVVEVTGNPLDVAIASERGLFAVQTPGGVRYTRAGAFAISEQRELVTSSGEPVLDKQGRRISLPLGPLSVSSDGTIFADGKSVAQIGLFDSAAFRKVGGNLYEADAPVQVVAANLRSGALEGSNVNAVEAMVQMISIGRSFELAQKSIQSQDEQSQKLIQSMNDRG